MGPPSCPAGAEKSSRPCMKSSSLMLRLVAKSDPVFTEAVRLNTMPLGLSRKIWPLEIRLPKIWVGSWSRMRLSAAAEALGCVNLTVWFLPMLKLDQSMTVRLALGLVMVPLPATTCPPWGLAEASRLTASSAVARVPRAAALSFPPRPVRCPCSVDMRYSRFIGSPHLYIWCGARQGRRPHPSNPSSKKSSSRRLPSRAASRPTDGRAPAIVPTPKFQTLIPPHARARGINQ